MPTHPPSLVRQDAEYKMEVPPPPPTEPSWVQVVQEQPPQHGQKIIPPPDTPKGWFGFFPENSAQDYFDRLH